MTTQQINAVCKKHSIHETFYQEFRDLVQKGVRPGSALRALLAGAGNYQAALREVLTTLSQPYNEQFDAQFQGTN